MLESPQQPNAEAPDGGAVMYGADGKMLVQLPCPDCDRAFQNRQGLARHRVTQHGYVSDRTKKKRAQERKVTARTARSDRKSSPASSSFDADKALRAVYPDGKAPASAAVLPRLAKWLAEGEELSRAR
jgi:uncharacterized C2H2 Zn-finger protein